VDEVERGREDVSRGAEDSDNDVGNEHGKLRSLFRDTHDFVGNVYFAHRVEHECRNRFAGQTKTPFWERHLPGFDRSCILPESDVETGDPSNPDRCLARFLPWQANRRMWFRMIKLAIRLGMPGKCAAAESTTSRFTPERSLPESSQTALSWSIEVGLKNLSRSESRNDRVLICMAEKS